MIVVEQKEIQKGIYYKEMLGLSSETKPTKANTPSGQKFNISDDSIIVELDTKRAYYYKDATDSWTKVGG